MRRECPECEKVFYGKQCGCGYKAPQGSSFENYGSKKVKSYFFKDWTDSGCSIKNYGFVYAPSCCKTNCANAGTLTHSTHHTTSDDADWYCSEHFL